MLSNCGAGEDTWKSWTARSNQSILKEINPEYPLEGLMLNLKFQYFSHLMQKPALWKRPWCWESLKEKGERGCRGWDGWMASPTQRKWIWTNSRRQWRTGKPGALQSVESRRVRRYLVTEEQQEDKENWATEQYIEWRSEARTPESGLL